MPSQRLESISENKDKAYGHSEHWFSCKSRASVLSCEHALIAVVYKIASAVTCCWRSRSKWTAHSHWEASPHDRTAGVWVSKVLLSILLGNRFKRLRICCQKEEQAAMAVVRAISSTSRVFINRTKACCHFLARPQALIAALSRSKSSSTSCDRSMASNCRAWGHWWDLLHAVRAKPKSVASACCGISFRTLMACCHSEQPLRALRTDR